MKPIPLQLITVKLQNGDHGVFIGSPLIANHNAMQNSQIKEIWFSDIRDLPDQMQLDELMTIVQDQICQSKENIH